jgi:GT2 family glycosyltransferase
MKMTIGLPILNQHELTVSCLKLLEKNAFEIDEVVLIDNSTIGDFLSYKPLQEVDSRLLNKIKVIRNNKNVGAIESLNQIWRNATGDIIFFLHNDTEVFEKNYDVKLKKAFEINNDIGIVGGYGAKGIGTRDIYTKPYEMCQLARGGNVSNARMDKDIHGFRNLKNDFENVAVLDGFMMVIKKEIIDKTDGFGKILFYHHNQDNLICIQSIEMDYENIIIPFDCNHIGGQTDVKENWTAGTGKSKQDIHSEAHPPLWEYGKGKLPIWIEDIYDESLDKIVGYSLYMDNKLIKTKLYE